MLCDAIHGIWHVSFRPRCQIRHGILHEEHFFELAADMTVEVEFVVDDDEATRLLDLIRRERLSIFYARVPVEFGAIEGDR